MYLGIWHFISGWPTSGSDVRQSSVGKIYRRGELQQGEVVIVRDGVVLRMFSFTGEKEGYIISVSKIPKKYLQERTFLIVDHAFESEHPATQAMVPVVCTSKILTS